LKFGVVVVNQDPFVVAFVDGDPLQLLVEVMLLIQRQLLQVMYIQYVSDVEEDNV
jgi:hypothetical protein